MRIHQAKNRITHMHNSDGILTDDYDEVKDIIVKYYKEFFTARECITYSKKDIGKIMKKSITSDQRTQVCRAVTKGEVESVMLGMEKGKTPGPDGFSA
ncbi:hypothetical protein LIER_32476 [Lithospermum erythrorhizon]|uniref:Uncharacterized protein n=1 Tax=Lithospermum erythrorhizon TaxID=34254 RepID=A0AAV3RTX4_LITER